MKDKLWMALLVCMFGLLGLACPSGNAQEKKIELSFANLFPPPHGITLLMNQWCEDVEKGTNGRVKVTQFPGGVLTPSTQTYASVLKGIADMGLSFASYTHARFPLSNIFSQPLGCKDAYVATKMANAMYEKFKPKGFDDVKVCFLMASPPQIVFTRQPIRTMEDMKGLKFRSGSAPGAKMLSALGAVPVEMPMSDAYDALQKGAINGLFSGYEPMKGFKLAEVVSHATEHKVNPGAGVGYIVMNKDKWNAMPPDVQKIIDKINVGYVEKFGKLWLELEKGGKDCFIQKGGKISVLSEEENTRWREKVRPLIAQYVEELNSKGLPGDEVLKFCYDYIKTHQ